ncbi:MAG: NAD(P)H-binding protein [Deltaproteobacteria bacterium]|jgi:NADH dehydrogenase|nr:NAD(P)H-binding protein [Deltaproteobacteria bacterium]MCL5879524.1 NAD(P)H-binding protein [Deltaproteobacteria bacterium]MDA8305097.1 NAD(P)H-binding protein [Deltaproteobacteria bacterium]
MRVFITGGTGFVGSAVSEKIKSFGASVTLLERNKKKIPKLKEQGFEVFEGTLEAQDAVSGFLSDNRFDAIINLIGIIRSQPDFSFQKVHVDYVKILLDLAKKNGIDRFVHMSALGASVSDSEYFSTKYEGEALVKNSGLKWTVFRPSLIFGDNAAFFDDLINLVKTRALVPIIGTGETKFAPIDVFSIANAYNNSLYNEKTANRVFQLCGPDVYTFEGMIDLIMELSPPKKLKLHTPSFIAEKSLGIFEKLPLPVMKNLPITSDQIRMLKHNNICDADMGEADELFELKRAHLKDWLKEYLPKKYN